MAGEKTAIVLGGGVAGLLAARVLTDHFDHVTLIEKDALASGLEVRKAAPQGAHAHALLSRGRQIFDRYFPGFSGELVAGGACLVGIKDARVYVLGWRKGHESTDRIVSMTRPFLEWKLADRVRGLNKIEVVEHAEAVGALGDSGKITGVVTNEAGVRRERLANFIVDARGRRSNLADWMKQLGYASPPHETSPLASVYTSGLFETVNGDARPPLHQIARFEDKLGVLLFPVEQERVLVSLGANAKMALPESNDELLAVLKSLPVPDAYNAVRKLRLLTPLSHSRFAASVRRNFHSVAKLPEGIVAIGDAVASFNPIFGQGMTVAALEAEWLDKCLSERGAMAAGFARAYYAGVKPIVDLAWGLPDLEARRSNPKAQNWGVRFLLWYTERMQRAASRDAYISRTMNRVQNMIAPPAALFSPSMFARVLFA